jgi:HAMP domain-containing protein
VQNPIQSVARQRLLARIVFAGLFLAAAWAVGWLLPIPVASFLARMAFRLAVLALVLWLAWRTYQRLLWRVSGRLAFSYVLIGVVPIPLAAILVLILAYGLTGFYLGRLFHDTAAGLRSELALTAALAGDGAAPDPGPIETARYRNGRKASGAERAPESWPAWLVEGRPADAPAAEAPDGSEPGAAEPDAGPGRPWVVLADGTLTLATAAATAPGSGTVAFIAGDVAELISERSGIWVQRADDRTPKTVQVGGVSIRVGEGEAGEGSETVPLPIEPDASDEPADTPKVAPDARRDRFFAARAGGDGWADRALFNWLAVDRPPADFATGERSGREIAVFLQATPRMVARSLFGQGTELVQGFWVALLVVSLALLTIYAIAELVAITMIVGLSRAVSRLYAATLSLASGDFSVRIPVRRRDQVGALQRSFNTMAENLEDLVATSAQKELLEKELQIARQVQQSLIPKVLPGGETVEFSTLFEPSAAIGGDYFDVLRLSDDELAVVVADVSGHGLPTGLRMAMVKAALGILVVEIDEADEILRRLDRTVRTGDSDGVGSRFFVTAVFTRVNFRTGVVELTNAGHPPPISSATG